MRGRLSAPMSPGSCGQEYYKRDECLRAATCPTGRWIRYALRSPSAPPGCVSSATERKRRCLTLPSV